MRTKLWLACAAVAAISTSASGAVVVVRSLGPSAKAYPPGKTLPETAKMSPETPIITALMSSIRLRPIRSAEVVIPRETTVSPISVRKRSQPIWASVKPTSAR